MSGHLLFLLLGLGPGAVYSLLGLGLVMEDRSSGVINFNRVSRLVPDGLPAVTGERIPEGPASSALRRRIFQSLLRLVYSRAPVAIASARQDDLKLDPPAPGPAGPEER